MVKSEENQETFYFTEKWTKNNNFVGRFQTWSAGPYDRSSMKLKHYNLEK